MDTNAIFLNYYRSTVDNMEQYKSSIFEDPGLIAYEIKEATSKGSPICDAAAAIITKNKMQGLDLLKKVDRTRYGKLLVGIRDKFVLGINGYLKTLHWAYGIIESYAATYCVLP